MDLLLSKFLATHANGDTQVWNDVYSGKINVEIAIYGSSRAYRHINPQILHDRLDKTAYNFGISGHNFWLQYLRNLVFQNNNPPPDVIIHSVDINTLQKRPDLYDEGQFLPFMLWNKEIYDYTHQYEGFSKFDYSVPMLRYAKRGNVILLSLFDERRNQGYLAQNRKWNHDMENARAQQDFYEILYDQPTLELYDRFLSECREKNIQVIMVYTPEYIEGQEFVKNRDELIARFRAIAEKHALIFLDYSSDPMSFDKQYFYNALHMNQDGAEIFTKQLAEDLKKIGLDHSESN